MPEAAKNGVDLQIIELNLEDKRRVKSKETKPKEKENASEKTKSS